MVIIVNKYFNYKFLNRSFWLALILAYIIPTKEYKMYGYPFGFFKINSEVYNKSLVMSSEFMILSFLVNVIIIFIVLNLFNNLIYKIKNRLINNKDNIN